MSVEIQRIICYISQIPLNRLLFFWLLFYKAFVVVIVLAKKLQSVWENPSAGISLSMWNWFQLPAKISGGTVVLFLLLQPADTNLPAHSPQTPALHLRVSDPSSYLQCWLIKFNIIFLRIVVCDLGLPTTSKQDKIGIISNSFVRLAAKFCNRKSPSSSTIHSETYW